MLEAIRVLCSFLAVLALGLLLYWANASLETQRQWDNGTFPTAARVGAAAALFFFLGLAALAQ